jgi:hypothetical protein
MNALAKPVALLALAATVAAPLLTAFGLLGDGPMKAILLVATIAWFAAAPRWLKGGND